MGLKLPGGWEWTPLKGGEAWACPDDDCGRSSLSSKAIEKHIGRKRGDGNDRDDGGKRK
jgi:hypothetical protein